MTDPTATRRRLSTHFQLYSFDVASLLPSDWESRLIEIAKRQGTLSRLDGASTTSRERQFQSNIPSTVTVVDGIALAKVVPWLFSLYHGDFLQLVNSLELGTFVSSTDVRSAINLNCQGEGERYEWHVDSNPLTGVLLASTAGPEDGGELVFVPDPDSPVATQDWEVRVPAEAGTLLLFDARCVAHTVEPVCAKQPRVSVPMNYYFADGGVQRPTDLDPYLYEVPR